MVLSKTLFYLWTFQKNAYKKIIADIYEPPILLHKQIYLLYTHTVLRTRIPGAKRPSVRNQNRFFFVPKKGHFAPPFSIFQEPKCGGRQNCRRARRLVNPRVRILMARLRALAIPQLERTRHEDFSTGIRASLHVIRSRARKLENLFGNSCGSSDRARHRRSKAPEARRGKIQSLVSVFAEQICADGEPILTPGAVSQRGAFARQRIIIYNRSRVLDRVERAHARSAMEDISSSGNHRRAGNSDEI